MSTDADLPPLIAEHRWSASYVSYWQPMLDGDQLTSGCVWFDYERGVFRIDGLFNPWDEARTGHRLWMSEINHYSLGVTRKYQVPFARSAERGQPALAAGALVLKEEPSSGCLLPRDVLRSFGARRAADTQILGEPAHAWHFERPGRSACTYYLSVRTGALLRMVTGDPSVHASVRDFPCFSTAEIPDAVFSASAFARGPG